jgi:hypothetical protein
VGGGDQYRQRTGERVPTDDDREYGREPKARAELVAEKATFTVLYMMATPARRSTPHMPNAPTCASWSPRDDVADREIRFTGNYLSCQRESLI